MSRVATYYICLELGGETFAVGERFFTRKGAERCCLWLNSKYHIPGTRYVFERHPGVKSRVKGQKLLDRIRHLVQDCSR